MKFTCHLCLSNFTMLCHMAGIVCLLQTCFHSQSIQAFIQFSLIFYHYLVFKILPWKLVCIQMSVAMKIIPHYSYKVVWKHLEVHLIVGHLCKIFHPTSFSQCSHCSPQFSSYQSETPVFRLWDIEYRCLCSTWSSFLQLWIFAVVCSSAPELLSCISHVRLFATP